MRKATVTKFKVGDRVGVGCFIDSCRECDACKADNEQYCTGLMQTYNGREKDRTPTMGGLGHMGVKLAHALGAASRAIA